MRPLILIVVLGTVLAPATPCFAVSPGCDAVAVKGMTEVPAGAFSLMKLLAPATCPVLVRAAAEIPMGNAPLAGSVRVFRAADIWGFLEKLSRKSGIRINQLQIAIPSRVTVRRAGSRAGCAELRRRLLSTAARNPESSPGLSLRSAPLFPQDLPDADFGCGAAGRISDMAALAVTKTVWDPVLRSWDISARCTRPADCVPFLVRVPANEHSKIPAANPAPEGTIADHTPLSFGERSAKTHALEASVSVVRRGDVVSLLWENAGIRVVVPAISLDAGAPGTAVRARITRGGRVVTAIVVGRGILRAAS